MRSLFMAIGLWIILSPGIVSAYNNVKFVNHCPYDVYSWTVGPAGSGLEGKDHEAVTIPANSVTVHGMYNGETMHGGIAIKLRDIPKYQVAPAGIIQVEYNLEPSKNNLWYDLSAIDCNHNVGNEDPSYCPLTAGGMKVSVQKVKYGRCPTAWCGADGCHNVYKEHGFWQGEPTFRCDAGTDILVELCTERAGPRTFNGHLEPGHPADPDMKPGNTTANGVCGAKTSSGATCFGYAHGACCSSYGWCGDSDAHCGDGCQAGFGKCFGQSVQPPAHLPPSKPSYVYQPPAHSSTVKSAPGYNKPLTTSRPAHSTPSSAFSTPASSYAPPTHTRIEHTWPSYSKPTSSYVQPSTFKSIPAYSKPTTSRLTSSYRPPMSSHSSAYTPATSHSKLTPAYSKPTSSYAKPSIIKSTSYHKPSTTSKVVYSTPSSSSAYSRPTPPYSVPPYRTIYATRTVTETQAQVTKTVTLSIGTEYPEYDAPTSPTAYHNPSSVHHTPISVYHTPSSYSAPPHTHTPQQEPSIPPSWYSVPTTSSVYHAPSLTESHYVPTPSSASYAIGPIYYPPVSESYSAPTSSAVYYPPARA